MLTHHFLLGLPIGEFFIRHYGLLLVFAGVIGEVIFDWKEMVGKWRTWKRLSALILVLGLALEFNEASESDKEVAILAKQTGEAYERAANTEKLTEELRAQNSSLEMGMLKLEKGVDKTSSKIDYVDPNKQAIVYIEGYAALGIQTNGFKTGRLHRFLDWSEGRIRTPDSLQAGTRSLVILHLNENEHLISRGGYAISSISGEITGMSIANVEGRDVLRYDMSFKGHINPEMQHLTMESLTNVNIEIFWLEKEMAPARVFTGKMVLVANSSMRKIFTFPSQIHKFFQADGIEESNFPSRLDVDELIYNQNPKN